MSRIIWDLEGMMIELGVLRRYAARLEEEAPDRAEELAELHTAIERRSEELGRLLAPE